MESLKEKTTRGLMWAGMNNVVQQGLGLLIGIVVARKLSRQDYGMVAMIMIFSLVANALQESGFKSALANLKSPRHEDYNAVFWFNVLVGVGCYVVLFLAAPLIAAFYRTPELTLLCRVYFLGIVFSCLGTAQSAYLFCNLMVKEQSQCNMKATVISNLVGLTMALTGCGYWALAVQMLVYIGLNTLLLWHASAWRPTIPTTPTTAETNQTPIPLGGAGGGFLSFFAPVRRMFVFSSKLLATSILERINTTVMNVLLGRFYTKAEVGDYNQAYQWSSKVFYLMQGTLQQVAQPVFTNVADERERQLRILRKLVRFTAFLSFPMLLGLGLVSEEFIVLTIGEKWIHSAHLLRLLCLSGAFVPVCSVLTNLLISRGRSSTYFWVTLCQCVTLVLTVLALRHYGIRPMVVAYVIIYSLWAFVWHFFVERLTGYSLLAFVKDVGGFGLIALGVMVLTGVLTSAISQMWLLLIVRVVVAAALYYMVMRLLHVKILDECVAFVKGKLSIKH